MSIMSLRLNQIHPVHLFRFIKINYLFLLDVLIDRGSGLELLVLLHELRIHVLKPDSRSVSYHNRTLDQYNVNAFEPDSSSSSI